MCITARVAAAVQMVTTKEHHTERWEGLQWHGGVLERCLGLAESWLWAV